MSTCQYPSLRVYLIISVCLRVSIQVYEFFYRKCMCTCQYPSLRIYRIIRVCVRVSFQVYKSMRSHAYEYVSVCKSTSICDHTCMCIYPRRCRTSLLGQSAGLLSRGRRFDSGKNSNNRELKSTFEHIELPAKQLDYFLRSNKSNMNLTCQKTSLLAVYAIMHVSIIHVCVRVSIQD